MSKEKNTKNVSAETQAIPDDSFMGIGLSKTADGRYSIDLLKYTYSGKIERTPLSIEHLRGDAVVRAKAEFLNHVLEPMSFIRRLL